MELLHGVGDCPHRAEFLRLRVFVLPLLLEGSQASDVVAFLVWNVRSQ